MLALSAFASDMSSRWGPRLDNKVIGRAPELGDDDLGDIDPEPLRTVARFAGSELDASARDLGFAGPGARVAFGRVSALAVKSKPWVSAQVNGSDRSPHHAETKLAVRELDLGAADSGRAVTAEGRHRMVLVSLEDGSYETCELRLGVLEVDPICHPSILAGSCAVE